VGAAWHCQHLWDQFAFGQDTAYLRETAYPLMKGAAVFYLQNLVSYKGKLILAPAVSAEHGAEMNGSELVASSSSGSDKGQFVYNIPGSSQDLEMMWDLFSNTISAARILNTDSAFAQELQERISQLLPLKIGKYGQLQEWDQDIDNPEGHHRHISHLYAVAPGHEISPYLNNDLAEAAKKSLNMRGEGRFLSDDPASGGNWSMAHRMWCRARLLDGDRANNIFTQLITNEGFENLLTFQQASYHWERKDFYKESDTIFCHFQLDASASIPGFMAELLLQSHLGEIDLLPALPKEWSEGSVRGLRARGGYAVDLKWKDGQLEQCTIRSASGKAPVVRVNGQLSDVNADKRIKFVTD
jgi:alpha-L-fucosidase 2